MNRPEGISPEYRLMATDLILGGPVSGDLDDVVEFETAIAKAIQSSVEAERERAASYHDDMAAQHEAFRSEATGVGIEHHAKMVRFHVLSAERIRKGA